MTEIIHFRCDRCDYDMTSKAGYAEGWAHCRVDLKLHHFCPNCWKEILKLAGIREGEEENGLT